MVFVLISLLMLWCQPAAAQMPQSFPAYMRSLLLTSNPTNAQVIVCQRGCGPDQGLARMRMTDIPSATAQGSAGLSPAVSLPGGATATFSNYFRSLPQAGPPANDDQVLVCPDGCGPNEPLERAPLSAFGVKATIKEPATGDAQGSFPAYFRSLPLVYNTNGSWSAGNDELLVCPNNCPAGQNLARARRSEPPTPVAGAIYYAPNGNDASGDGTQGQPFATPQRAQQEERQRLASGQQNVTVYGRGGTYRLEDRLEFTAADSAPPGHAVTWASYPGERAVWSGGVRVTSWTAGPDGVWQATVPSQVPDFREFYINGTHRVKARGQWYPNGWGTYGNIGICIGNLFNCDSTPAGDTGYTVPPGDPLAPKQNWGNLTNVEIVMLHGWGWARCHIGSMPNATTVIMQQPCQRIALREFYPYQFVGTPTPSWVENAKELLATCQADNDKWQQGVAGNGEGCWYFDRPQHILYYKPEPGENMNAVDAEVPRLEAPFVTFNAAHNIEFENLTFTGSSFLAGNSPGAGGLVSSAFGDYCTVVTPVINCRLVHNVPPTAAITIPPVISVIGYSHDLDFAHNKFFDVATRDIILGSGTRDVRVYANLFVEQGSGCMMFGGQNDFVQTDPLLQTDNLVAEDNACIGPASEYWDAMGIYRTFARDTKILHNTFDSVTYSPIATGSLNWSANPLGASASVGNYNRDNATSYNRILNPISQWPLVDGGPIYHGEVEQDYVLQGNYSKGLGPKYSRDGKYMHACWYPDQLSSNMEWSDNVCDGPRPQQPCGLYTGNCWAYAWTNDISNVRFKDNFATTPYAYNQSAHNNVVIDPPTIFQSGHPPPAAQAIIDNSGIEAGVIPGPL